MEASLSRDVQMSLGWKSRELHGMKRISSKHCGFRLAAGTCGARNREGVRLRYSASLVSVHGPQALRFTMCRGASSHACGRRTRLTEPCLDA